MRHRQSVLEMLSRVAAALEPELPHLVSVGGAVVALYDMPTGADVRLTGHQAGGIPRAWQG